MSGAAERRRYHSPRRREQADATRASIAAAAREVFTAMGWAGTRIRDIAAAAGVAEATVYAAYGSKAGLAIALVDAIDREADIEGTRAELENAEGDPAAQLGALVRFDRRLFEGCADVLAALRDGGREAPELAAAYREGRARADEVRRDVMARWPARALRDGVDVQAAADTYAALCNLAVFRVLTDERGWTPARVEAWWHDSTARLLLR